MQPSAVIFDFGGVFTTSPVSSFAVHERANGLPHRFIGAVIKARGDDGAFARFERAEIDLDAFDAAFAAETRAAGHEVTGRTLVSLLALDIRPDMVAALDVIKSAGYKTGCITNNMPHVTARDWMRTEDERVAIAAIMAKFDAVIESSKVGIRKPEPRIYQMMCEVLDVTPEQAIFVDDLGINLKPAKALGMATVKVPFDDYREAFKDLSALTGVPL